MSRFVQGLDGQAPPDALRIAPWLESAWESAVAGVPRDRPIFGLVNFADAHEPYYEHDGHATPAGDPGPIDAQRQDRLGWLTGRWVPTQPERERLLEAYRSTLRLIDSRLRRVVDVLRACGRWDRTSLVVTG